MTSIPGYPGALALTAFLRMPLEAPLTALLLMALPPRFARPLAVPVTLVLAVILFLKLADLGTQAAFQRVFNPWLDLKMLRDGWDLLTRSTGKAGAWIALAALFAALAAILTGFYRAALRLAATDPGRFPLMVATLAVLCLAGFFPSPVTPQAAPYLSHRVRLIAQSIADISRFETELAAPLNWTGTQSAALEAMRGRDLVVIFVESYGRSAIEDDRYAPLIRPRLGGIDRQLDEAGLSAVSGWLTSPTAGGLSWLAHATMLSGLTIGNQARYDRLMRSERQSLNRLFSEAGWQSVAIMPAITRDWPESRWYGYDRLLSAGELGYRGLPFNWVTMPDQYTLSAFERLIRQRAHTAGKAVMAEIALISSHAPWTPVPEAVAWEAVGDGAIFTAQALAGDTPAKLWADPDRVRDHYIKTIDYSLEILGDYLTRFAGDGVFVILGDHQPAAIVTGANASRAVPVHVVTRDRRLIERLRQQDFGPSMLPAATQAERPMAELGQRLLAAMASR